jgi:abortive infection alpha-like protein
MPESEVAPYSEAVTEVSKAAGKFLDIVRDVGKPVADAYGLLIGDRVEAWRERNLDDLARRTKKILKDRDLKETAPLAELIAIPLLGAAQGDPRPEMQELWATLLANAMDPARRDEVRREFITVLKQLHPTDALVLKKLDTYGDSFTPADLIFINELRPATIAVSLRNLSLHACIEHGGASYRINPFGSELIRACTP